MQVYNICANQTNFAGLKLKKSEGDCVTSYLMAGKAIKANKDLRNIDKDLSAINADVSLRLDNGKLKSAIIENINGSKNLVLDVNRFAKVSEFDERIVEYPVRYEGDKYCVSYNTTADAEKNAWEFNFGDRIVGVAKAALDIAKSLVKN